MTQTEKSSTATPGMPFLYRILRRLFLHHAPTKREQASADVAKDIRALEQQQKENIQSALKVVIQHVRGDASAVWACHCCQYQTTVILIPGEHPVGILKCEYYKHVYCVKCTHTSPMVRWRTKGFDTVDSNAALSNETELPCVSVCRACGVSWRARATSRGKAGMGRETVYWGFGRKECVCGCAPTPPKPWAGFKVKEGDAVEGNTRALLGVLREELTRRQNVK